GAIRVPGLGDGPVEFLLRGYTPGSRATFEARAGGRRVAVKAYAEDPAPEAALYEALAAAGLGGVSDVRVPPLLAWERDLRGLAESLARTQPKEGISRLVHGTLYARHIIDLGDGPGVIDWQRFGQGPVELDAGTFLGTVSRIGLLDKTRETEAMHAREAFLAG